MSVIPALGCRKQKKQRFKVNLSHIGSSKPAWTVEDSVSSNRKHKAHLGEMVSRDMKASLEPVGLPTESNGFEENYM